MAYYENKVEHLDGDLILYQRNLSTAAPNVKQHRKPKWYMKLRIAPNKVINRSTGLTVYEEAYSFARKEFDRLRNAVALGHTLEDFTFEKHWDDWYQRNVNNGTWRDARQRWHKNQAARYYKAYFRNADGTSMRLNEITPIRSSRTGGHFSNVSLSLRFKAIYQSAGIKTSSHSGRRTFATRLNAAGIGMRTIQNALGHANIQTTALYCDVTDDQLANAVNVNRLITPV